MNELIFQLISRHKEFSEHEINYQSNEELPLMKVDSGLLETVLDNLIYNAIQYTPTHLPIEIEVHYENNQCTIRVLDTGPGFREDSLEHVFEKFYRVPDSKAGGTGLGLSIVKGFVEAHGGRVDVKNRVGGGAQFSIHLPVEISFMHNLNNE
jgi:two-component system sensor histidine kinase KdpD